MPAAGSLKHFPSLWLHQTNHDVDQHARREILAGAAFGLLGHLLQQAIIGVTEGVALLAEPVQSVDGVDQLAQIGRFADNGGGILEDRHHRPVGDLGAVAEVDQRLAIALQHLGFAGRLECRPAILFRNAAFILLLRGHFQEQQVSQFGDVLLVGDAVLAQQRAKPPQAIDEID